MWDDAASEEDEKHVSEAEVAGVNMCLDVELLFCSLIVLKVFPFSLFLHLSQFLVDISGI